VVTDVEITVAVAVTRPAFADFYAATWPDVSSFCRSFAGSGQIADDVAQEAFTRLYVRYPLLREPRAYLFRTARNLLVDALRGRKRDDALVEAIGVAQPVWPNDGGVLDAVHRLSPPLRDAVLLHYYADLSVDDVARALRRPIGTVKRRLHDARRQLATDLGEEQR
jgi:RNA polymerase sigma-70 factor (ECF subfamily)